MTMSQKKAAQRLVGIGLGAALFHVCPPAAIVLGLGSWLGACRRMANAKDDEAFHDAALDVFTGYPAGDIKAFTDQNGRGS